jgi:GT2 family glycosyltransferase
VDNGSDDGTYTYVRRRALNFSVPLCVIREPQIGLSSARNRALRETDSELVLFLDDDVTCDARLVESHIEAFQNQKVVATGGRIIPCLPATTPDWFRIEALSGCGGPTARYDFGDESGEVGGDIRPLPIGANFGIRREVALANGGFDERLGWGIRRVPGEETRLLERLKRDGCVIVYVPDAIVHHRIGSERTTLRYFTQWYESLGRYEVLRNDRPSFLGRLRAIIWAGYQFLKWSARLWTESETVKKVAARRRRARARGRLLELISLRT